MAASRSCDQLGLLKTSSEASGGSWLVSASCCRSITSAELTAAGQEARRAALRTNAFGRLLDRLAVAGVNLAMHRS
jgi:hypothetical protein